MLLNVETKRTNHLFNLLPFLDPQLLVHDIIGKTFQRILNEYQIVDNLEDLSTTSKVRIKRSVYSNLNKAVNDEYGVYRLTSISPSFSLCSKSSGIELIFFKQWTLCVCFSSHAPFNITIGTLDFSRGIFNPWPHLHFTSTLQTEGPLNVKAFTLEHEDTFFLLIADESRPSPGIDVLEVDERFNVRKISSPNIDHPSALKLFYPKGFRTQHKTLTGSKLPHLIVANRFDALKSNYDYRSITKLFHWKNDSRTFDEYDVIDTYLVKDICTFSIENNDYLVIVNHQAGLGRHQVDSEVFKFDVEKGKYRSIQKIATYGAVDCEAFTLGMYKDKEHFLAIANQYTYIGNRLTYHVSSPIYKFMVDKFVPFHCIKTQGAYKIKAIYGPDSKFVLSISSQNGVQFYQYNGWTFEEVKISHSLRGFRALNMATMQLSFETLLVVNDPRVVYGLNVFRFNFIHDHSLNDWYQSSLNWCNSTLAKINDRDLGYLNYLLQDVYYVDQPNPINITGDLIFHSDLDVNEELAAPSVSVYGKREIDFLDYRYVDQVSELEKRLDAFEKREKELKQLFNQALKLNGDQEVSASFTFDDITLECHNKSRCHINDISVRNLNGRSVVNLTNDVLRIDRDEQVKTNLKFKHMTALNQVNTHRINGLDPNLIVTKSGYYKMAGEVVFESPVFVEDLRVNGTINGRVIDRGTVLVSDGYQRVKSNLIFEKPISVRNLNVTGLVSNFNTSFDSFLNNLIIKNGYHQVSGVKHFKYLTIENLNLKPGVTLNGVDVIDLHDHLFWTTGDQKIYAPINFNNLEINGHILTNGQVNNIPFNSNHYALSKGISIINATKVFNAPMLVKNAYVERSINGIENVNHSLDLLLTNWPQSVPSSKTFSNIYLNANAQVVGTVNGLKLSRFVERFERTSKIPVIAGKKTINGNLELHAPFLVDGLINGINLTRLFSETVKVTNTRFPNIKVRFQNLIASTVSAYRVNNYNLATDFMTTNTPQTINGSKIFTQNVMVNHHLSIDNFNGLSINRSLSNSLFQNSSQFISGSKTIYGDLYVDHLKVKHINDADMNDLVPINKNVLISAPKHFQQVKVVETLKTVHVPNLKMLNGHSFHDIFYNSLRREWPQRVTGRKHFAQMIVPQGHNLIINSVNGHNLKDIAKNVIYKDVNHVQVIYGRKYFYNLVNFEQFNFNHSFDEISATEFNHGWLQRDQNQVINGNIKLVGDVRIKQDMNVLKMINNIDLVRLNNSIVKTNEPVVIQNPVSMLDVYADRFVNVAGTVNGIKIREDVVWKNSSRVQVLTGHKYFINGLEVENSLNIDGLVNGISLSRMCLNAANRYASSHFNQSVTIDGDLIVPTLSLYGSINQINFEYLNRSLILTRDTPVVGKKRFKSLIIEGPAFLLGTINNYDLKYINDNCLSRTKRQTIKSQIIFQDGLVLNKPTKVRGHIKTARNAINGINLQHLYNTSLLTDGYQELRGDYNFTNKVYFNKSLEIPGSIVSTVRGPLNLKQDIMLRNRANVVNVPVIFESPVVFSSNATMNKKKRFGGINMDTFEQSAVFNQPNLQFIQNQKHFNSLEVDELFVKGYVNNLLFQDKYILRSDRDEVINGRVIFKDGLQVRGSMRVSGYVNNVNITHLENRMVLKNRKNVITAPIYFNIKPRVINITSLGLFGGLNLTDVRGQVNIGDKLNKMRAKLAFQDSKLKRLTNILHDQASCFEYYEYLDRITEVRLLPANSKGQTFNGFFLLDKSHKVPYPCDTVQVRRYNGHNYELRQSILIYQAIGVSDFWYNNENYLIITSDNPFNNVNSYATRCLHQSTLTNHTLAGKGNAMVELLKYDRQNNQFVTLFRLAINKPKDVKFVDTPLKRPCIIFTSPFNVVTRHQEPPSIYCLTVTATQTRLDFIERLEPETRGADKVS